MNTFRRASESKTICRHCERAPGRAHSATCPRSRDRLKALRASLTKPPRLIWKKGFMAFRRPNKFGVMGGVAHVTNPGVPYVKGQNRRAGGTPRGKQAEASEFLRGLGLEAAP